MPVPAYFLPARSVWLPFCLKIYNHYAVRTSATFHTEPQPLSFLESIFFRCKAAKLPFLIALNPSSPFVLATRGQNREVTEHDPAVKAPVREDDVLGYCYVLPFRAERLAYMPTVEISLFLAPSATGLRIGGQLLHWTIYNITTLNRLCQRYGIPEGEPIPEYIEGEIRRVVATIAMEQTEDVGEGTRAAEFWEGEDFVKVGVMMGVGWKFGRWVDVGIFQRELGQQLSLPENSSDPKDRQMWEDYCDRYVDSGQQASQSEEEIDEDRGSSCKRLEMIEAFVR
ncbi:MAG: hypothetical protein Q9218_002581 [Villophora microphyllina]